MDIVLGVSMAPSSIQMVVLEGEYADGATVEEDTFDVTDVDDAAATTGPDQVISAILGTREGAIDAGLDLSSIGVTWTDPLEAAALRDALTAHRIDNVMLVSAFLAAAALAQNVGGAMGYERTAVLLVEPDSATLAVVETADGSIPDVYKQQIRADSYGDAGEQLSAMVAGMEKLELLPGGLFLVGSGVDVAPLKPVLQSTTSLDVSVAEEPETALARGAALASANAPLFASSTAALAYAQDPGTGAVDQYSLPEYLYVPSGQEKGDDELAYSAVGDDEADSPTVVIEKLFLSEESQPKRRPVLLVGSGLAVVGISAVLALEIALAIGIRTTGTVGLQPTPGQHLIVPEQAPAPAPVQASEPLAKISPPAPAAAPQPLSPPVAAPLPAVPPPAAPPLPAAPVVPVPVVVPPVPVPVPVRIPLPNPVESPPMLEAPRLSIPQPVQPQRPVHIPEPPSPPKVGVPQSPPHQTPPGAGTAPKPNGPGNYGGGHNPTPGENGPGGLGGGHIPTPGTGQGGLGGGHVPTPGSGPGGLGGGHVPTPGENGPGGLGGGHVPTPGSGPGGLGGGHVPTPGENGPGGLGGGHVPTPPAGGPGGGGLGGFGGGHAPAPGGGLGGFGGGHAPAPGGGGLGGFGGGHSGGGFGGGGGGFGGGHSGGGFGGGGFGGGHSGGGGGHH
ncbi:hypothetical protein [Mycobacterium sp. E2479]|uniref:DUF7159 family protein n=1 Tax=Mycobacterium sp. E2479 TaxID=1834134 RepID=UPI0007FE3D5A|nr:hypothetical protein [Mycobacterium sp. E2479]OBH54336.1 hypothetical protein A5686_08295 [Mycobacterium sp. E2479]